MTTRRPPATVGLAAALFVLAVPGAAAQVARCDRRAHVRAVILTLLGYEGSYSAPLEARIEGPRAQTGIATPQPGGWVLELQDSTPAGSLDVRPVVEGYVAHLFGDPTFEPRAATCAVRLSFRLEKAWHVEVDSRPRGLRVVGRTIVDSAGRSFANQTLFETPPISRRAGWELEVVLDQLDSYVVELRLGDFAERKKVVHEKRRIRDALCSQRSRGCTGVYSMLLGARALPEYVSVRLVSP